MPGLNVQGQPVGLTIFYELLQTSGLLDMLNEQGPFTVFIPNDDAFANLPAGVLEELRNNPELLRRVLLSHVVNRSLNPKTLQNNMIVETNNNRRLFVNVLNDGKLILIGGSNLVASTLAQNGEVYVINGLIYPIPGLDIFTELKEHSNLSQLLSLIVKSGLQETLHRNGPYTVFAPTDAAFEALPKSVLQDLLSNPDALQELIMNHVVEGVHYEKEFTSGFNIPTSRGKQLQFFVTSDGVYRVNDANIQESDISTGNGVIHVIDRVLFAPPVTQPGPGTPDDSQVQQQPQLPEKPLSGQSNLPTTGPSSEQEHPQPDHEVSTSGQPEKPPSQEVFVRIDSGQVPSPPRLEVEGGLPPTNTILQVIKMPGLNVQGQSVGLTIFYELLQTSGLLDMLSEKGPFTVFIPTDDAFANLPAGVLEELRNNPESLRRVLLCHVVNRSLNRQTLQNNMIVETNNGRRLFVNVLNGGKLILIGGSKLTASTSVQNGDVYVINDLIYPIPGLDIFTELKEHPNLSQLMSLILTSGLQETLLGNGPYTIFAPTDTAFAAVPDSVLQELMSNPDALQELIMNHVVEGVHYKKEFTSGFILPTSRGKQLQFILPPDGVYRVNDANIQEFDISTGNGVIHVIDHVLFAPPVTQPGPGTSDDSQVQQQPQLPEKPLSGQSNLPTTGPSSEQEHPQPGHEVSTSGQPEKPPSQEVFVRIDSGQVPSPPRLEVEGGPSQRNKILQIIKMPGLNIQGKLVGLSIFYELLETSGLLDLLREEGPFTVLVPTDDAFVNLPDGVLEELRDNPELLRRVLLTHILGLSLNPQTLQNNMVIETNNGLQLFIKVLNDAKKILIGGAKLIASTVAQNGYVYVINNVIYPVPDVDIFAVIKIRPNFSQLLNLIETSGLEETLHGNGSFTFFAPTNEAFAAIPQDVLQNLSSDSKALREVLLNHVVDGVHYKKEFISNYELQTSRGKPLRFLVASDGSVKVNDANIVEYDISTGNGVIHFIDHVLFTPQSSPEVGVRTLVVSQEQRPLSPQESVTPNTDRTTHPSTTGQSQHPGPIEGSVSPHGGPVPSLPELKAGGVTIPSTKNTIVQIIEMPDLDVQDQPVSLSNFNDLIQVSGLTNLINQQKPFTVLVPTDDAFSRLPEGLVKELKNNTELLQRVLLFHIINFSINPQSLQNNMVIETNNGRRIFINVLDGGKNVLVEGSKVIASTPALNGYIYIITGFNYPLPSVDIFTELKSHPSLARLATSIVRAGLEETLTGESPYTIFAPTDEAFAALPENDLQQLLVNPEALKEVILNHLIEGVHYQNEFKNELTLPTARGQNLRFLLASDGTVSVNDAKVIKADISTGNGVIHVIDRLLVTSPDVDVFDNRSPDSVSGSQAKANIAELARGMGVETFFSWLTETGLDNVIQDGGEYTVFAPTNEAVASLPETIQTSVRDNPDRLRPIVKYHISPSIIQPNQTQNEQTVTTLAQDKNIRFNYYQNGSLITAGGATIGDIRRFGNIVIIVINRVLYGPQGNINTIVSSSPILKDLSRFIELIDLQDHLQATSLDILFLLTPLT
ncbi:uncharacterized protein LOC106460542 [Limulus polyphemus]|uniref:Uncharacterized protein LOC106460542 n=1 Tax=Limulus polyphemus TaxID=6850 RepID=A0ABM1B6C7_LIMPO|nr:uncharacterized protein LOC106460542 [Limulus polyphemus]